MSDLGWMREICDPERDAPSNEPHALTVGEETLAIATNGRTLVAVKVPDCTWPSLDPESKGGRIVRELVTHRVEGSPANLAAFRDWVGLYDPGAWMDDEEWTADDLERRERYAKVHGTPVARNVIARGLDHLDVEDNEVRIAGTTVPVPTRGGTMPAVYVDGAGWRLLAAGLNLATWPKRRVLTLPEWPLPPGGELFPERRRPSRSALER